MFTTDDVKRMLSLVARTSAARRNCLRKRRGPYYYGDAEGEDGDENADQDGNAEHEENDDADDDDDNVEILSDD